MTLHNLALAMMAMFAALPVAALEPVKFATASASLPGGTLRLVADLGLFEKHGIAADVVATESNTVASMALLSGSVQFFTASGAEGPLAQAKGQDIVGVTAAYAGIPAVLILGTATAEKLSVKADAPVEERLKALGGLIIASPSATSSYTLALAGAAAAAGTEDIEFTYLAMNTMTSALEARSVDGFISSSPFYVQAEMRGFGVEWLNLMRGDLADEFLPRNSSVVYTTGAYAAANPAIVEGVRAAYQDFAKLAETDYDAIFDAALRVFPNLNPEELKVALPDEIKGFVTEPLSAEVMAHEIDFVRRGNPDATGLDALDPEKLYVH